MKTEDIEALLGAITTESESPSLEEAGERAWSMVSTFSPLLSVEDDS